MRVRMLTPPPYSATSRSRIGSRRTSAAGDPHADRSDAGRALPRFDALYSPQGRRSIAPEKLLRALLVQVLYTIRSERQLMEGPEQRIPLRAIWHYWTRVWRSRGYQ
jgi:hypothetical protein